MDQVLQAQLAVDQVLLNRISLDQYLMAEGSISMLFDPVILIA